MFSYYRMCSLTIECVLLEYMLWRMLWFVQEPYLHVPYLQVPNLQARHLVYVSRDMCHVICVTSSHVCGAACGAATHSALSASTPSSMRTTFYSKRTHSIVREHILYTLYSTPSSSPSSRVCGAACVVQHVVQHVDSRCGLPSDPSTHRN